jgi:hypothetical protein
VNCVANRRHIMCVCAGSVRPGEGRNHLGGKRAA